MINDFFFGEGERRDRGVEGVTVVGHHLIRPVHDAHGRRQGTEARVLERLPRLQARLFPDHSGPLHFLGGPVGIGDDPMPADQLHGLVALVGDADVVGEEIPVLRGLGTLLDVLAFHLHLHPPRRGR